MTKTQITSGLLAGLMAATAIGGTVSAQSVADATGLTEAQAIEIALLEIPGEVLEVDLERDDGIMVYEVEILTADNTRMEVEINADTGDVVEIDRYDDDDDDDESDDD